MKYLNNEVGQLKEISVQKDMKISKLKDDLNAKTDELYKQETSISDLVKKIQDQIVQKDSVIIKQNTRI